MAKQSFSVDEVRDLATQLYKYVDFKSAVVQQKVKAESYMPATIGQLHSHVRSYLYSGKKISKMPKMMYTVLDELKNTHYAKLTPSEQERAKAFRTKGHIVKGSKVVTTKQEMEKITTKTDKLNISIETLDNIKKQQEKQRGVQHKVGILLDGAIRLFENESYMSGYLAACKDIDMEQATKLQLVDVVITPRV